MGGRAAEIQTAFSKAADRYGFVAIYVTITKPPGDVPPTPGRPDVLYVSSVIDRVVADENIDPAQVYVTGGSAGGSLSYRFACEFSNKVAAIGAVSAVDNVPTCKPSVPVSVIAIHGTKDQFINFSYAQAAADHWRAEDACPGNSDTKAAGRITRTTWSPCRLKTAVSLIKYEGGDHGWYADSQINATETLWSFFDAHPRKVAASLSASLRSVSITYKPSPRRVRLKLTTNGDASIQATLTRSGRTVASKRAQLKVGTNTVTIAIPRSARAGRYTLTVSVTGDGGSRLFRRTLSLKR